MITLKICDLDGTICDDRHRRHLIKPTDRNDRWDEYHAQCWADKLMNAGCVAGHAPVLFFTARPERCREMTHAWLANQGLCPRHLRMRANNDARPSVLIKEQMLLEYATTLPLGLTWLRAMVVVAYDDRADVLAMYRKYGIQTIKVGYEEPKSA